MSSRLRRFGVKLFDHAMEHNVRTIRAALAPLGAKARIADLGCRDGIVTRSMCPPGAEVVGVELDHGAGRMALHRDVRVASADLNHGIPFADQSVDAAISNQVFEHLHDTDTFLAECYRIVRPGGLVLASTENLASWHNVFAVALGWQAFSLTPVTRTRAGLGNPLALLRDEEPFTAPGMQHLRVMSFRGLKELMNAHGFRDVTIRGSGYYPLPASLGSADPRHAAFITAIGRRPQR